MKLDRWHDKPLHWQRLSRTDEKGVSSRRWLQTGYLKKETESLLMAAQDQTLATKPYRATIFKQQSSNNYRVCNERDGTVVHTLSEYLKLVQTEYKKRHDKVATMVHWKLCSMYGFESIKHWYEHRAGGVMKNQDTNILWDFSIKTEHVIKTRLPDIVLNDKKNQETFIIDVGVPGDFCVWDKEAKKTLKYQDFALEVSWIRNIKLQWFL